jgi:hypothetical protein
VSEDCKPTETAAEVLQIMREQWLSDIQCAKIRELQSNLNESNELVEYLQDRIKRLEEVGDEVVINYVNSLSAFEMWRKAKEAKP